VTHTRGEEVEKRYEEVIRNGVEIEKMWMFGKPSDRDQIQMAHQQV